eukprot:UN34323
MLKAFRMVDTTCQDKQIASLEKLINVQRLVDSEQKNNIAILEQKNTELCQEADVLKKQNEKLENNNTQLKKCIAQQKIEVGALTENETRITSKYNKLEDEHNKQEERMARLEVEYELKYKNLKKTVRELEMQNSELLEENKKRKANMGLKKKWQELSQEHEHLKQDYENLSLKSEGIEDLLREKEAFFEREMKTLKAQKLEYAEKVKSEHEENLITKYNKEKQEMEEKLD